MELNNMPMKCLDPNNLRFLCTFAQKYIHINIFHNNSIAMLSSVLFLTFELTDILRLNLCIKVDKYRQNEQIYRQIQCMEAKFVTYFTYHRPVICWLASCMGGSRCDGSFTCLLRAVFFYI